MSRKSIHYNIATTLLLFVGVVFLFSGGFARAATDDFKIQTLIGSDTTPPSTPTGLTATPVAISQINLTWASSTDDYILSGYQVWRDDIQIATTTSPAYIDTGLASSTLYTYYVTAFDSFFNFSASSTAVATTTLSPSVPAPTASGSSTAIFGSRFRPLAEEVVFLEIIPTKDSAIIRYITKNYIRSVIQWGRSSSYEIGSLVSRAFLKEHETVLTGLSAGTQYSFVIEGENVRNQYGVLHTGTFVTLPPEDIFPSGNVMGLTAVRDGDDVMLSWNNPRDVDFTKVRVMRNERFYPTDIADGWVVYEGSGTSARDTVNQGTTGWVYYTVFTYDALGNISSGAVTRVYLGEEVPPEEEMDPTKNEIVLSFTDVSVTQEGETVRNEEGKIYIDGAKQFTIAIPYERVPAHLKTILVTMRERADTEKYFSFLLRVNLEKTAYIATVAPLGVTGDFPIQIAVFDFTTAQIGYTHGVIVSDIEFTPSNEESGIWIPIVIGIIVPTTVLLLILRFRMSARRITLSTHT